MKVYIVVNEGDMKFVSTEHDIADGVCETLNMKGTEEEAEESGRDIEDLSDEELAEFAFMNGYNGGYHEVCEVNLKVENVNELEGNELTVELNDGTVVSYYEIFDLLMDSSEGTEDDEEDFKWDSLE